MKFLDWNHPRLYKPESHFCCWLIVFTLTLASTAAIADLLGFVVVMTQIQGFLAIDNTQTSWLGKAFFFPAAIAPLFSVRMAYVYGFKKMLLVGLVIFWLGSILSGFARDFPEMLLCRINAGLGGGIIMAVCLAYLNKILPQNMIQRALIIYSNVFFGMGITAGVLVGGYFGQAYHWREVFILNLHLAIPTLIMVLLFLPETKKEEKPPFDFWGFMALSLGLLFLLIVVIEAKNPATTDGWYSNYIQGSIFLSMLFFAIFAATTYFKEYPLINVHLFKHARFTIACLGMIVVGFQVFGTTLAQIRFYEDIFNFQRSTLGWFLSILGVIYTLCGLLTTFLSNVIRPRIFILLGLSLIIYANFANREITIQSTMWQLGYYQCLRAIGVGLVLGPFMVLAFSSLTKHELLKASSFIAFLRFLSATFGSSVVDLIVMEREPFHALRFGEMVDIYSPRYQQYFTEYQQRLLDVTSSDPTLASDQVTNLIIEYIDQQASLSALNDALYILAWSTLAIMFLIIVLASNRYYRERRAKKWLKAKRHINYET